MMARRLHSIAFMAATFGVTISPAPGQESSAGKSVSRDWKNLSDDEITEAVDYRLLRSPEVLSYNVDVTTDDGLVTLTGSVENLLAKQAAGRIARGLSGVRRVDNELRVEPARERTDEQIRKDVESALAADPAADSYEIDISVEGGVVTLAGEVESFAEYGLAERVAKSVKGVKEVDNELEINYADERTDAEIAADVRSQLEALPRLDAGMLEVTVNDGRVKLSGTVGSAEERERARFAAWVAGVEDVDDSELNVDLWWDRSELRGDEQRPLTEETVRRAIENRLAADPRVSAFDTTVRVRDGVAMLTGTVDSYSALLAAVRLADETEGVDRVRNLLKVRPTSPPSDAEVADDVKAALTRDPYASRYQVGVSVYDGRVTLTGEVDSAFEKERAETVAAGVDGVLGVRNLLRVDYDPRYTYDVYDYYEARTEAEIREDIEDEMFWSPWVDSKRVSVVMDGKTATLTGTVESESEKDAAEENAFEGGATAVINELEIDPSLP